MSTRTLIALAAGLAASPAALAQTYSITALPTTAGTPSQGFGINDAGKVCGQARFGTTNFTSLWHSATPAQALGSQPGYGNDINNADQVFGSYYGSAGAIPFVWENNAAALLPLVSGFSYADNWQLNNSGVGTGSAYNASTPRGLGAACTWTKTGNQWVLTLLPALSNPSAGGGAFGINEAGIVVGTSADAGGIFRACKWDSGVISALAAPTPNSFSIATSINSSGRYVGFYDQGSSAVSSAFVSDGVSAQTLASLPGFNNAVAYLISDSGSVIGWSYNGNSESYFLTILDCAATIWRDGVPLDLNTLIHSSPAPGYHLRQPWDINGSGQIAAYACVGGTGPACTGGNWRAVILTPCYANCDSSTGTPVLTANDFQCFLNKFAGGSTYANCDASTGTPSLTANDFQCFLNKFAAGCS